MSLVALFGGVSPGWGSPGDVLTIDVPILGNEVPKSRDLATGDASVSSQTGALTYSFAISVPPGRLVEPSLALAYSSSAAVHGSPAGAGWSLSIPEIRNDPAQSALAAQSTSFIQHYVSSLAGGNRLVEVDEPAAADVLQTYRAQFDGTYARYERLGPGRWRVRTTDGLTHFFGEADHMPDAATGVNDPTWAPLTRTVDPFGNTVHYYYFQVKNAGGAGVVVEHVLDRIEYTANPAAGIDPHAQVDFLYSTPQACGTGTLGELPVGARFEPRSGAIRWVGSRRLDAIVTRVRNGSGWRDVRTVTLGYDEAADDCAGQLHGPVRLLTSIRESARSPDGLTVSTMPPVTLNYGALVPDRSVPQPFARGFALAASPTFIDSLSGGYREGTAGTWPQLEAMLLDLDGDGRLDRLFAANDPANNDECAFVWQRNQGNGFGAGLTPIRLPTFHWGEGAFDPQADCSLAGQRSRFENMPNCLEGDHYLSYRFIDINGDQLPELVAGLQYEIGCLDLDPFNQPSPIPAEWGWDPDRVCPQGIAASGGEGWCPYLAPGALGAAEVCEPSSGCQLDLDAADEIVGSAPRTSCGELMEGQAKNDPSIGLPGTDSFPRRHLDQCGEYLWLIYWNRGGGVIDTAPTPRWSPIPLESNGADTALGSRTHGFTSSYHAIIDIDGDGLVDVLTRENAVDNAAFLVFRGDGTGNFRAKPDGQPYVFAGPPGATTGNSSWTWTGTGGTAGYGQVVGSAGVMDISGDGLLDLFLRSDGDGLVHSYLNLGNRFQYSLTDWQNPVWLPVLTWSVTQNAFSNDFGTSISSGNRAGWMFPLDWDGDGRLDLYQRDDVTGDKFNDGNDADDLARIYSGDGGGFISGYQGVSDLDRDGPRQYLDAGSGDFRVMRDFVDLDGDGSADVVEYDAANDRFVYQIDTTVSAGTPPRILNRIDNGAGGLTEIRYRASSDSSIDVPGTDDALGMPTHTWVVDTMTRTDAADALSTTGTITGTTTYRYGRPIFNQERHPSEAGGRYGFRGFERVQMTSPLGAVIESVYDYTLDWSGRLVETTVYASDSDLDADHPSPSSRRAGRP